MPDREKVIKGLECCTFILGKRKCDECPYAKGPDCYSLMPDAKALLKAQEPITGETSDGYHTFNELYHHRAVLFSVIVSSYPERAWKAKKHHDGTMYDGMFIVGIETPSGQATYHYDINPYWDMFKCRELANAPEWDGHTPAQAIERIGGLAGLKVQEPRVMTLEEVRKTPYTRPIYCEWREGEVHTALISPRQKMRVKGYVEMYTDDEDVGLLNYEVHIMESYGETWRCWTSRPTDEQREAVKWE